MLSFAAMSPAWRFPLLLSWIMIGALLFLEGCALGGPEGIDAAISYPVADHARHQKAGQSGLVVETELFLDLNLGDPEEGPTLLHTGYTVYSSLGRKLLYVRNYIGKKDTEATRVPLEPGDYLVLLEKPGSRSPIFRVKVEGNRLTLVSVQDLPKVDPPSSP